MGLRCEKCGQRLPDRKERFCQTHREALLRRMEESGYLEPRYHRTISGVSDLKTLYQNRRETEQSDPNSFDS